VPTLGSRVESVLKCLADELQYCAVRRGGEGNHAGAARNVRRKGRGANPAVEANLKSVGERVRLGRACRGMSRKALSKASSKRA
jgi:ribosome-binding protein aMBF1 (putative translation factor)